MDERLRIRIKQFNEIKYGNDNETRIVFGTLTTKRMNAIYSMKKERMNAITCLIVRLR